MKKGIPIALLAGGMIAACQVKPVNHPVHALAAFASRHDTVFFYNENGALLFCDTNVDSSGTYVMKTCLTKQQIFKDWYDGDTTKGSNKPAEVKGISLNEAYLMETVLLSRNAKPNLVKKFMVPILDKKSILKMLNMILAGAEAAKNGGHHREYGGIINLDSSISYFTYGDSADPSKYGASVNVGVGERGNFHSHPKIVVKKPVNGVETTFSFFQGPSRADQDFIKNKIGYVFGMRDDYRRIYIYDSTGVLATLPFEYFESECNNK